MKIAIIGAGNMGGSIARGWQKEQSSLPVTSLSPTPPRTSSDKTEGRIPRFASD